MASDHRGPLAFGPLTSPGRRDAVRALAGVAAAIMALTRRSHATGAPTLDDADSPAGPEFLQVAADRKKKRRRGRKGPAGPTGPTGPTVPAGTFTVNETTVDIPVGSNNNAQTNCLSGRATGSGASISNISCHLVSSNIVGTSAWGATGKCPDTAQATLTVQVVFLG